jgi:hypothetical protein
MSRCTVLCQNTLHDNPIILLVSQACLNNTFDLCCNLAIPPKCNTSMVSTTFDAFTIERKECKSASFTL